MNLENIYSLTIDWLLSSGISIIIIIVVAFIAMVIGRLMSNRIFTLFDKDKLSEEGIKRAKTLSSLIRHAISMLIYSVAIIMILDKLGIEIGPILAAAGIAGLAIGFGAQTLVQDIISGFFILMEDQIRVGDVVEVAGKSGLVERVNLRMTVLRDLTGQVHFVRNGQINIVSNMTKEFSYYVFDIGVAYREKVDEVIEVIKEVDTELRQDPQYKKDILEPIEILGLDKFADSAVIIKARIKTRPIKQWTVGRAFNLILKKKFDERNIEIPFPHVTVYMGQDKAGEASPLHLLMDQQKIGSTDLE